MVQPAVSHFNESWSTSPQTPLPKVEVKSDWNFTAPPSICLHEKYVSCLSPRPEDGKCNISEMCTATTKRRRPKHENTIHFHASFQTLYEGDRMDLFLRQSNSKEQGPVSKHPSNGLHSMLDESNPHPNTPRNSQLLRRPASLSKRAVFYPPDARQLNILLR